MNIIDAHCHLPKNGDLKTLINDMDEQDVSKTVLIFNTQAEEEALLNNVELFLQNKNRFIILAGLNPHRQKPYSFIDVLKQNNIKYGIKLHSRIMKISIEDFDIADSLISEAGADIVMVDCFSYGPNLQNQIGLELSVHMAQKFTKKSIIIAHSGGIRLLETMLYTRPLSNVSYDLSLTVPYLYNTSVYKDMLHFINHTSDRIMYGSDHPDFTVDYSKSKFNSLFIDADLQAADIENIMYKNALKIYSSILN